MELTTKQWILIGIGGGLLLWGILIYNRLIGLRNQIANAFAQIDVQLKRRNDLIPNLVETAKGYLQHERQTLEAVIVARNQSHAAAGRARANPGDTAAIAALDAAESALGGVLGRLMMVVEAYPELKADANMRQLTEELTSTENRIGFARQAFNDSVLEYNNGAGMFPANVVAGLFRFRQAEMLRSTQSHDERQAPRVSFS